MADVGRHALLERELRALGRELESQFGDVDLSSAVVRRLAAGSTPTPIRRGTRRRQVIIALVAAVGVTITVALPSARAAINRVFDFGTVTVTDEPPPVTVATATLELGDRTSIDAARGAVPVVVPTDERLGAPDEVWFDDVAAGQVSLVYDAAPGLPAAKHTDVGLLLQEFVGDGRSAITKFITTDTRATPVTIAGADGVFLSGGDHALFYSDASGADVGASGRLVGNALVFQRGELTIRIEGDLSQDRMVEIAESLR